MLNERSVETVSTRFNVFKNKGNVETMLNESLHQFKLIQHTSNKLSTFCFALSTMLNDLLRRTRRLVQQSVENVLKEALKPFKLAFSQLVNHSHNKQFEPAIQPISQAGGQAISQSVSQSVSQTVRQLLNNLLSYFFQVVIGQRQGLSTIDAQQANLLYKGLCTVGM